MAINQVAHDLECLGLSVRSDTGTGQRSSALPSLYAPLGRWAFSLYVDRNGTVMPSAAWIEGKKIGNNIEWVRCPEFDEIVLSLPKRSEIRLRNTKGVGLGCNATHYTIIIYENK